MTAITVFMATEGICFIQSSKYRLRNKGKREKKTKAENRFNSNSLKQHYCYLKFIIFFNCIIYYSGHRSGFVL